MIELLLLGGSALCVISVVMAVVAVAQTRAPRGAAIALMLGIIALAVAAKTDPAAVTPENTLNTWQRLFRGEITLRGPIEPIVSEPASPASEPAADASAPDAAPAAETGGETGSEAGAESGTGAQ